MCIRLCSAGVSIAMEVSRVSNFGNYQRICWQPSSLLSLAKCWKTDLDSLLRLRRKRWRITQVIAGCPEVRRLSRNSPAVPKFRGPLAALSLSCVAVLRLDEMQFAVHFFLHCKQFAFVSTRRWLVLFCCDCGGAINFVFGISFATHFGVL